MPQALPLQDKISDTITKSVSSRTLVAKFGDGYEQRSADGLNAKIDVWEFSWIALAEADKQTVLTALDAVGGHDYFTWTPSGETAKKFIVVDGKYTIRYHGALALIACQLRQVFDL